MTCTCRNCGKRYNDEKSRADYTGYCTQKCMKAKAKSLGWNEAKEKKLTYSQRVISFRSDSLYAVLKRAKAVGSVPVSVNSSV